MEQTYDVLTSVWDACLDWFELVEESTGIPVWGFIIAFAVLAIIFRHVVFPMISVVPGRSDSGVSQPHGRQDGYRNMPDNWQGPLRK